jgi:hypothetical protein
MAKERGKKNRNEHKRIARGQPSKNDQRGMVQIDCISRGPHHSGCICGGSGKNWVSKK